MGVDRARHGADGGDASDIGGRRIGSNRERNVAELRFETRRVIQRRGLMLVLSSPSGAGKTSLARRLLASDGNISMSVSATTRPRRASEVDGQDYIFLSRQEFEAQVSRGDFLEWAEVFGNCYGTPRAAVETWLSEGRDVLFDVDWQGAQQIRNSELGRHTLSIFILPPSIRELRRRLEARGHVIKPGSFL